MIPHPQQDDDILLITRKEFVELANVHTDGISPSRIMDISIKVTFRSRKASTPAAPDNCPHKEASLDDEEFKGTCELDCGDCLYPVNPVNWRECPRLHSDTLKEAATIRNQTLLPIKAVYERFKHLDKILSEKDNDCPHFTCYAELWGAIKESLRTHEHSALKK